MAEFDIAKLLNACLSTPENVDKEKDFCSGPVMSRQDYNSRTDVDEQESSVLEWYMSRTLHMKFLVGRGEARSAHQTLMVLKTL